MHLHAICFFALLLIFFNLSLVAVIYTQLLAIINAHILKIIINTHACSQRLELMREMYHNEAELSPTSPDYNVESLTGGGTSIHNLCEYIFK